MYRIACLMALFVCFVASAQPVAGPETPQAPLSTHLVRYVYQVSWTGAEGDLGADGQLDIMLQADLKDDQQTLYLVHKDGTALARVLQAGTTAFISRTGRETEGVYDLTLGSYALGFPLGLRTVVDWLQAQDAVGPVDSASVDVDSHGKPTRLTEAGWIVDYGSWQTSPTTGYAFPSKVTLTREGAPLRVELTLNEGMAFDSDHLPEGYRAIKLM
jgi:hypothetical protein